MNFVPCSGSKTNSNLISHWENLVTTLIPVLRYLGINPLLCSAFPHLWQHAGACMSCTSFLWDNLSLSTCYALGTIQNDLCVMFHLFLTIMLKGLDTKKRRLDCGWKKKNLPKVPVVKCKGSSIQIHAVSLYIFSIYSVPVSPRQISFLWRSTLPKLREVS